MFEKKKKKKKKKSLQPYTQIESAVHWCKNCTCCSVIHKSKTVHSSHGHCIQHSSSLPVGIVAGNLQINNAL